MQSSPSAVTSAWQQLRRREITCEQALDLLVDSEGNVNFQFIDWEVSRRFLREFLDVRMLPPVVPLLLWRSCYYLGSPVTLSAAQLQQLSDRTFTTIQIIPINDKSYRTWYHKQNVDQNGLRITPFINPLTGEAEPEDIAEVTELYLSNAADQISRIKTIISGALRNRASDIHLEPTSNGLRGLMAFCATLPCFLPKSADAVSSP